MKKKLYPFRWALLSGAAALACAALLTGCQALENIDWNAAGTFAKGLWTTLEIDL